MSSKKKIKNPFEGVEVNYPKKGDKLPFKLIDNLSVVAVGGERVHVQVLYATNGEMRAYGPSNFYGNAEEVVKDFVSRAFDLPLRVNYDIVVGDAADATD